MRSGKGDDLFTVVSPEVNKYLLMNKLKEECRGRIIKMHHRRRERHLRRPSGDLNVRCRERSMRSHLEQSNNEIGDGPVGTEGPVGPSREHSRRQLWLLG